MTNNEKKSGFKFTVRHWITTIVCGILAIAFIVGDVLCGQWASKITLLLCGDGVSFESEAVQNTLALGAELVENIVDESIVLMKNDNDTLPLKEETKVNLFGHSSSDEGFIYSGTGSGAATINKNRRITLQAAFEKQGFEVNKNLLNKYTQYHEGRLEAGLYSSNDGHKMIEPNAAWYSSNNLLTEAKNFSNVAIVTIARFGGEGYSIKKFQPKYNAANDNSRMYLQLTTEEEEMLNLVKENFDKVIVLLNCSNPMELGFLNDDRIDAVLHVGYPGVTGAASIAEVVRGKVTPSGHTTTIYPLSVKSDPASYNTAHSSDTNSGQMSYVEDIYVGYKWYETAFVEGYFGDKEYSEVVQYPFGYGMSYTTFSWNIDSVTADGVDMLSTKQDITNRNTKIEVKVTVTNTGEVAGKDVVQLYYTPPYIDGGIEKAHVNLIDFDKTSFRTNDRETDVLQPGESDTITLQFEMYDMASYDAYDKNENGMKGYELDAGEYSLKFMTDSHTLKDCTNAEVKFNIPDTMRFKRDTTTKQPVKNRFTGESAYAGVPSDGNGIGIGTVTYLTRSNFAGTFPTGQTLLDTNKQAFKDASSYRYTGYDNVDMPTQGVAGDLRLWTKEDGSNASAGELVRTSPEWGKLKENETLMRTLVAEYTRGGETETWTNILNQISIDSLCKLCETSGFINCEMPEIGKKAYYDYDGPSGFQSHAGSIAPSDAWTGYPASMTVGNTWNKSLAYQQGRALGSEAIVTGINGFYAPGANICRTPYVGRYFEFYSEDARFSGIFAGNVVAGAKTNNMYCFMKHFAVFEGEKAQINAFITEQAMREIYLKPFEIAIKDYGANALMSTFNKIGAVWGGSNRALMTDILRIEWGFKGIVLSDYTTGGDYMNTGLGVLAGHDMMLCDKERSQSPLDRNDAAQMYGARMAAKNMIYTACDTYLAYKDYDASTDPYATELGTATVEDVFAWWIPALVSLNVAVFGIMIWQMLVLFLPKKKKETEQK